MPKAVRVEDGYAYCRKCYQVTFEPTHCSRCGNGMRAHYNDANPVCRDCKRAGRTCLRCGRTFRKAGRLVRGGAVCGSCAPNFNAPQACSACGVPSKRLSGVSWFDGPVCGSCRNQDHITCAVCHRYRPYAGETPDDKPVCRDCVPGSEVSHDCPDCGQETPGGGSARCQSCAIARRAWQRANLDAQLFEQDWCRDLFLAFCSWLAERCHAGDITRRIDNYARFFEILDNAILRPDQLSQSRLTELFSPEELRRGFMVVRFLIERHGVFWEESEARRAAHARRNRARLASCHAEPWCDLVEEYCEYLRAKPAASGAPLREGTIGTYLNAAIKLLRLEGVSSPEELGPDAIRRFVRSHPGYSASLTPFLSFLRAVKGLHVEQIPKEAAKRRAFERALVHEVRILFKRLGVTANYREARALIARLISRLYQLPLSDVLSLRWRQLKISARQVAIEIDGESVEFEPDLADAITRWLSPGRSSDLVFPGRIPALPLSSAGVDYHVARSFELAGADAT